jgi:hypothetical protein
MGGETLARFLRSAIDADRYQLSPRLAPLKAILAKLDPKPQPPPINDRLKPSQAASPKPGTPSRARKRR